jgi:AcrR family transcriptional regulator
MIFGQVYLVNQDSHGANGVTKKLKTEIRQDLILREALKMLGRQGLEEFRIADLADKVGLVPSGIYRHFKSKDDIVNAVLDFAHDSLLANVQSVYQESSDAIERLKKLLELHLRLILENPGIPRLVFSEVIFADKARGKAKVREILHSYLAKIQELIRLGQNEGQIRLDLGPRTGAVMFLGLIVPLVILVQVTGGKFDPHTHIQQSWPLFVELLQKGVQDGV